MELPELRLSFADRAELARELTQNLRLGRAFVSGASDVAVLSECVLVLVHPEHGAELRLAAQVVMVNASGPLCGMGVALRALNAEETAQLESFADASGSVTRPATLPPPAAGVSALAGPTTAPPTGAARAVPDEAVLLGETVALSDVDTSAPAAEGERPTLVPGAESAPLETYVPPPPSAAAEPSNADDLALDHEEELSLEDADAASHEPTTELQQGSRHERLRRLTLPQQVKLARTGELADRIAVERMYGKQVWETLLHNPRLSIPEVARIARKGTVPKPLLELILENGAWIKADAVRRALLGNPKLGAEAISKLLRATPKHELKLIEKGTAYGPSVRESARKLLKQ